MNAAFGLDPVEKVMTLNVSTDMLIPKYLYYLCEKILTIDLNISDWQDWSIQLTDTCVPIKQLKNMEEWRSV